MTPSICIITREFPPETAWGGIAGVAHMEAHALAAVGATVHVISLTPQAAPVKYLDGAVTVHRLPEQAVQLPADMPYVAQGLWSQTVAEHFARFDATVGFDVVETYDYFGEGLHLQTRPETLRVVRLVTPSAVTQDQWSGDRPPTAGERAFAALELVALRRADLALASSPLILEEARRHVGEGFPESRILPFPLGGERLAGGERVARGDALRAVFVGRLEPRKGPDLALRAVAAARARGIDVQLTLVGRDVEGPNGSYRRGVLVPLMEELGLDFGDVRFVSGLDDAAVRARLRASDVAIVPSRFESWHLVTCEAIAQGLPVITTDRVGVASVLGADDGLRALPVESDDAFAAAAADTLADEAWLASAGVRGQARIGAVLDPPTLARRRLELFEEVRAARRATVGAVETPTYAQTVCPRPSGPATLGIVVLAHNALPYTRRCVESIVRQTDTDFHLVLVDNASTDETPAWCRSLEDERITVVRSEVNAGVPGGRNLGLDALEGHELDYVVFLDNDVEVHPGWWHPFVGALEAEPSAGIAGEVGVALSWSGGRRTERPVLEPGPLPVDMVIGFCMVMRAEVVRLVGRFDEGLGLFWHDDDEFCLRATRLGFGCLHIGSGRLIHFGHMSSREVDGIWDTVGATGSELSADNQAYLARREDRHRAGQRLVPDARRFSVLAFAADVLERPGLLRAWCAVFGADDDASLVLYAPGAGPEVVERLTAVLADEGLHGDDAADLVLLSSRLDADAEVLLAQDVRAVLGSRPAAAVFRTPPRFDEADTALLHELARRCGVTAAPVVAA